MGITPQKLALTVALGFVIGILPLFGGMGLLCMLLGSRFRLNIPALLILGYLVSPIHLLLYLPFIKLGIYIFGAAEFKLSFEEILQQFRQDWLLALKNIWLANMLGVVAWAILSVPLILLIYNIMLPIFRKYIRRNSVSQPKF